YISAIVQNTFWKELWYEGTVDLAQFCKVASAVDSSPTLPLFTSDSFKSVQLPHHLRSVLPSTISKGQYGHAHYICDVPTQGEKNVEGIAYLSLGFVYGSDIRVYIDGTDRALITQDSRVFVPLNRDDLSGEKFRVEIHCTSNFDDLLGFT